MVHPLSLLPPPCISYFITTLNSLRQELEAYVGDAAFRWSDLAAETNAVEAQLQRARALVDMFGRQVAAPLP